MIVQRLSYLAEELFMRCGCDVVEIARFERLSSNEAFLARVFHPEEVKSSREKGHFASSLAARFAAKEAFLKALGTGLFQDGVGPNDVWVNNDERGRPFLCFSEITRDLLKKEGLSADVSLSHDGPVAMAVVLLFRN